MSLHHEQSAAYNHQCFLLHTAIRGFCSTQQSVDSALLSSAATNAVVVVVAVGI